MQIVKVTEEALAGRCDALLMALVQEEGAFDGNLNTDIQICDWYPSTLEDEQRVTFAAMENEEAVGFAHGFVLAEGGTSVRDTVVVLDALYVKAPYRKQGAGTALAEAFMQWGKACGAKFAELKVYTDNHTAIAFYQKHAFTPVKQYMRKAL